MTIQNKGLRKQSKSTTVYDYIILGAGISGIYSTFLLNQQFPNAKILIIEKYKTYGGRVYTFKNQYMTVNAGAGRFHNNQPHIWNLINDIGLTSKKVLIDKSLGYAPADNTTRVLYSNFEAPRGNALFSFSNHVYNVGEDITKEALDIMFGPKTIPNAALILKLIIASKTYDSHFLRNIRFIDFATKVLSEQEVQFINDSFGYYDKLHRSNAFDTLLLIQNNQSPINDFYTLKGGLGQINDKMMNSILKNKNVTFKYSHTVENIDILSEGNSRVLVLCKGIDTHNKFIGKYCISTLPAQALLNIPFFYPLKKSFLKFIVCTPMCRIFAKYKPRLNGSVWFQHIVKSTTNNNLRMVLPIDYKNGIIMISYCDTKFAKFWKKLYDSQGRSGVHRSIIKYVRESYGIDIDSDELIDLQLFYWDCAVGHWGIGANSEYISKSLLQPFENVPLSICGEQFSATGQQWMEGGLETAHKVVSNIIQNRL